MQDIVDSLDIMSFISVEQMNMELLLRLKRYRKKYLVRRSVINILPFIETSMNGLTLILITLEELPLRSRLKLLRIFSNIALIMDILMKMT